MAVEQGYKKNCITKRTDAQPRENGGHPLTHSKQWFICGATKFKILFKSQFSNAY